MVMAPFACLEVVSLRSCSGLLEAQVALIAAFGSSPLVGLVSGIFLFGQASLLARRARGHPGPERR